MLNVKDLAYKFVEAIIETKSNGEFKDRMSSFPFGCCDDVCDLFAYYLLHNYGIVTIQFNAFIESEDTYHNWLVLEDEIIIDLTIKQFSYFQKYEEFIYYGYEIDFYSNADRIRTVNHCDIYNHKNLYNDYQLIMSKM